MKHLKITDAELGLYMYFFVEMFIPSFCFFYTCGRMVGDFFYRTIQPNFYYLRTILGFTPQTINYQTQ